MHFSLHPSSRVIFGMFVIASYCFSFTFGLFFFLCFLYFFSYSLQMLCFIRTKNKIKIECLLHACFIRVLNFLISCMCDVASHCVILCIVY